MQPRPAKTIWVDVEDFLGYFAMHRHPGTAQLLSFEIMRALVDQAGTGRVRFVRRRASSAEYLDEVAWAEVDRAYGRHLRELDEAGKVQRTGVRRVIHSLPPVLRDPILHARTLQLHLRRRRRIARGEEEPEPDVGNAPVFETGDCFLMLGTPWLVPGVVDLLLALKHRHRMVVAFMVRDLMPAHFPEWVGRDGSYAFCTFLDDCLPLCDRLLACSDHTAGEILAYARRRRLHLGGGVRSIKLGDDAPGGSGEADGVGAADGVAGLPKPGRFVLVAAPLEPRRNPELAARVWRRLVEDVQAGRRDPDSVPQLVYAGRIGPLMGDFLNQLDSCAWLDGRIRLIRDPSAAELRRLHEDCLFTFVPSWFEGIGLPVRASLLMGKPCMAAAAGALPEAGGLFCRYFDPGDVPSAYREVAALLDDRDALAAWQKRIRQEFRPVRWVETAHATLAHLDG